MTHLGFQSTFLGSRHTQPLPALPYFHSRQKGSLCPKKLTAPSYLDLSSFLGPGLRKSCSLQKLSAFWGSFWDCDLICISCFRWGRHGSINLLAQSSAWIYIYIFTLYITKWCHCLKNAWFISWYIQRPQTHPLQEGVWPNLTAGLKPGYHHKYWIYAPICSCLAALSPEQIHRQITSGEDVWNHHISLQTHLSH